MQPFDPQRRRVIARIAKPDENELNLLKKRIDFVTMVVIAFIAVIIARLWFLQIHHGEKYQAKAENNRVRVLDIVPPRGNILDRNGEIIVSNRPSFNIVWSKEDAPDPDEVIQRIAEITGDDIDVYLKRMRESADNPLHLPIVLKEDIDWKSLVLIENDYFSLPGVRIDVVPRRQYHYGDMASHLIGYLGEISASELEDERYGAYQRGDQIGKGGFERFHEDHLHGEKGRIYLEVNAQGYQQRLLKHLEPLPGEDIRLNIDTKMQLAAEKALEGRGGAVVAMDVNSGRLLTMASAPVLHLQDFVGGISYKAWQALLEDEKRPLVNKTLVGQYPPGSTYKIVTALAGLTRGVVTPSTSIYCAGSMAFGDRRYGCWKKGGHGATDLKKAIAESCDVYFYQVGLKVGVDGIAEFARSLGLGELTGVDFEGEKPGLIPTAAWKKKAKNISWQEGETLSIAIGQGFNLTTPLQICQMTATVANGGTRYRPQLLDAILDQSGREIKTFAPIVDGHALGSPQSLALLRDGMLEVVHGQRGTARLVRIEGTTVAGKTGTAQVVRLAKWKETSKDKVPYKYRDHAWFTCYAPADKPEVAVTVLVEHGDHGGSVAGPIARAVLQAYFGIEEPVEQAASPASPPQNSGVVEGD